jgi:hypothetical protein
MKKLLLIAVLALSGCLEEAHRQELEIINRQLPDGCVAADVGSYGNISYVLVVVCKGRDTTSTSFSWTSGRTTRTAVAFQVGGVSQ